MIALNKGLALVVTALIVAAAIYHSAPALTNLTEDSQLDLSCGFSDDFTTFLNKNGNDDLIQVILGTISTGQTSGVLLLVEEHLMKKLFQRFL